MKNIKNIKNILLVAALSLSIMMSINTKSTAANTAKIKVETANLRSSASSNATILELLSMDESVEVLEKDGDWYKVKYKSIEGYLRSDLIDVKEEVATTKQDENKSEEKEENKDEETSAETTSENKKEEENNKNTETVSEESKFGDYKVKEKVDIKIIPLIQAKTITTLKENETVKVTDIKNNWAYVETDTNSGWVNIGKIEYKTEEVAKEEEKIEQEEKEENKEEDKKETTETETEIKTTTNTTKYVATSAANIREKASTSSDVLKSVTINTEVTVLGESNGWSKVQVNGVTGYISSRLLSDTKTATSRGNETIRRDSEEDEDDEEESEEASVTYSSSGSSQGESVVSYAKEYLGCNYVYGGTSPSGFDCSGFTQYVYSNFGVSLNRTAASQYSNGTSVTDLQAGDLVYFGKSGIYHVGIYIGGGSFIHAANKERGVTIDTLTSVYYKTNYVGARRIF